MRQAVCDTARPGDFGDPDDEPLSLRWRSMPDWPVTTVSANLRAFLGWDETIGHATLPNVLHPDDRARFLDEIAGALRAGRDRVCHADHRVVGRGGRVAWWRTVTLLRPQGGDGLHGTSHAFDITALRFDTPEPPADGRTLLQALIDSIPDLIFFKGPDSVYLGCNRAFADFLGRPVGDIVGRTDFDLVPADRAVFFRDRDTETLRLREPHRMEETVCFPDGRIVLLETIKTPYYGPSGAILGLVAVARDITEQARTQRDLRESERRLATLLGNLPGMAYRGAPDPQRSMLFVSDGGQRLTGHPPADLTGGAVRYGDLIHTGDRERIAREVREALGQQRRFTLNYRLVDRTGTVRHVWEQGVGVASVSGRLDAVEGFVTDISELRAVEESLRTLSLAVAQGPVAVIITDALGKTLYLNPRFGRLTGLAPDAVPDLDAMLSNLADPGPGDGAEEHARGLWRNLSAGETWRAELPALGADGRHFWAAVTVAPVLNEGRMTNIVGTIDDITTRRQAEERLRRAQKMQAVGVLAGGIAHDFNNILTAILGYAHLALDALPEASAIREDLHQVTAAADRAKELVRHLLAFSRQEKLGREPTNLRIPVLEALRLVRPTVPAGVQLQLRCEGAELPVLAAPVQLHQLVINLCKNAIDAIQDQGNAADGAIAVALAPLSVSATRELNRARLDTGRYACLTVADNGCGMGAATLERIFDPFFTTKPVDRGTGLGLAAVHGIVADHGGVIDVSSQPGEGTVFSVYLPLHDPEKPHRSRRFDGRRVLLLDGERAMLGMAGRLLRSQGFHVVASADSRRGLALFTIAPERFDVVVLAQGVTDRTWKLLTLARAFAAASPGIPILVCADPAIEREGAAIEAAGVSRILRMPAAPDQFVALVEALAGERHDTTANAGKD